MNPSTEEISDADNPEVPYINHATPEQELLANRASYAFTSCTIYNSNSLLQKKRFSHFMCPAVQLWIGCETMDALAMHQMYEKIYGKTMIMNRTHNYFIIELRYLHYACKPHNPHPRRRAIRVRMLRTSRCRNDWGSHKRNWTVHRHNCEFIYSSTQCHALRIVKHVWQLIMYIANQGRDSGNKRGLVDSSFKTVTLTRSRGATAVLASAAAPPTVRNWKAPSRT